MGAYLSIISGAIKFFNYIAAALQQHHDEMMGATAQTAADQKQVLDEVANQQRSSNQPIPDSVRNETFRD